MMELPTHQGPLLRAFHEIKQRGFRGEICWLEDFGTTWEGAKKWSYEMKFDSELSYIVSESVQEDSEAGQAIQRSSVGILCI
jgi:hypothetical protein